MLRRWLIVVALLLITFGLVSHLPLASAAPVVDPSSKIAPWVLAHTAAGAQAEFLVVLAQQADLSGAARFNTKAEKGRFVYDTLYQTAQVTQGPIVQWLHANGLEYRTYYIVNAIWVKGDRAAALALAARSDVARLDGNPQIKVDLPKSESGSSLTPASPDGVEPGLTYVHAPDVWAAGFTGQGIVVGGQDTGIQWDHPALKPHYRGWNGSTANHDYNWHDAVHSGGGTCGANSAAPCDDYGHGTHTMGTAVGSDGGTNQIGMAPGAKFIGCRNMNVGVGTPTTYLECFEFFLAPYPVSGTPADGDPSKAPDVTNNSWGCPASEGCNANTLLAAVQAQRAAGIMTVASAGNEGSACNTVQDPPGIYDEVYTVGALNTSTDSIADFSSRGAVTADGSNRTKPDISAPGTGTRSSIPGSGYGSMSGTSMASPHVAGAVALLWSARPELKNQITQTEQVLNGSAVHIASTACGSSGWPNNTFGYGRLDVLAAAQPGGLTVTSFATAQSAASGSTVTYTLRISNTGVVDDAYTVKLGPAKWLTSADVTTTAQISPSAAVDVQINVAIPPTAYGNQSDNVTVTLASVATPAQSATVLLTTSALAVYSTTLSADAPGKADYVGHTVMYTVRVTNTGNLTDTYAFSYNHNGWATYFDPVYVANVPPQAGTDVLAYVTIPMTATFGQTNTLQMYVTGTSNLTQQIDLVTTAILYRVFLPVVLGGG